jgi:hypothetical protein
VSLTASAGNVSTTITARRPSWADMERHYPASDISTVALYDQKLGGPFKNLHLDPAYENTCAVRMSYALNRSGLKLGAAPSKGGAVLAPDGFRYWIRVSDLKPYLIKQFKGADEELKLPAIPSSLIADSAAMTVQFKKRVAQAQAWLDTKLANRKGIVVFDVTGWGNATGHFTLWNGASKTLAYAAPHDNPQDNFYYFWLTELREKKDGSKYLIQVVSVKFWELK